MPEPNVTHRMLAADFLTLSYRVVGKMMTPNTGVVGMMNDPTTSFMEVLDAKLARIHMPTKLVGEYNMIDLVKNNVFAVCLTRREDVGPQALARGGYQNLVELFHPHHHPGLRTGRDPRVDRPVRLCHHHGGRHA